MSGVQAKEKNGEDGLTEVAMKFRPTTDLMNRPAMLEYIREDGQEIRVPLSLSSPDQVLPVEFELVAKLTTSDIVWEPQSLDFGPCFTAQVCKL